MIKHIVMWDLAENVLDTADAAKNIKADLESLNGKIDGLKDLTVYIDLLAASNADIVLLSTFESAEALDAYMVHPKHLEAAVFTRSVTVNRRMADYVE